jgi:hypothetical protein
MAATGRVDERGRSGRGLCLLGVGVGVVGAGAGELDRVGVGVVDGVTEDGRGGVRLGKGDTDGSRDRPTAEDIVIAGLDTMRCFPGGEFRLGNPPYTPLRG